MVYHVVDSGFNLLPLRRAYQHLAVTFQVKSFGQCTFLCRQQGASGILYIFVEVVYQVLSGLRFIVLPRCKVNFR
jgi:hypothetical protein